MRICYVSGNSPRIFKLMNDMATRGYDVHWIALDKPNYNVPDVHIYFDIKSGQDSILEKYGLAIPRFYRFRKLVKEISPDILHAINVRKAGWFSVGCGFKPVIVTTQGGDVMAKERNYTHRSRFIMWIRKTFIRKWLRIYTLRKATVVTFGNDTMLSAIRSWAEPKRTFKYFQGVTFGEMKVIENLVEFEKQLGVEDRKIVFSPRMFNSNANIDIVIRSIPLVRLQYPNVIYLFACHDGVDSYSKNMKKLVDELNVNQNCLFLKEIPFIMMPTYYSMSDVVISVLSSDGMPATILETMALKRTLVLSKISTYQELFSNYAVMADHRDVDSTAEAIIKGLNGDESLSKMKEAAYSWVEQHADQKAQNDNIERLYIELVNN